MDHVEYVYTEGMTEAEVDRRLRERGHGVLALADGDDSYAVPLDYHFDGDRFLLRVSVEPDSVKTAYAEATDTATFVVYDAADDESWSVLVRGDLRRLPETERAAITDRDLNEWFSPFRLFDEDVADLAVALYELAPTEITGRRTRA